MSDNPIFNNTAGYKSDLEVFENIGKVVAFKKGETLFLEKTASSHIVIVLEGCVKLSKAVNNKKVTLRYVLPVQFIGESLPEHKKSYAVTASFMTEGKAILIKSEVFEQMLSWSPNISLHTLHLLNRTQQYIFQDVSNKKNLNAFQRIALFLLEHPSLASQLKKQEIADIIDVVPETYSRNLRKLKDEEYLMYEEGMFKLRLEKVEQIFSV